VNFLQDFLQLIGTGKKTEKQIGTEGKINSFIKFKFDVWSLKLTKAIDDAGISFYSGMINDCRSVCINFDEANFSQKEQVCMRNCVAKFSRIPSILDKDNYQFNIQYIGPHAFLSSEQDIRTLVSMQEVISKKKEDMMGQFDKSNINTDNKYL